MTMRSFFFAGALLALAGCSHGVRGAPEKFSFDIQLSLDAKHCSVEATDAQTKAVLSVEVHTGIEQKSNRSTYEDLGSGQALTVELAHLDSGKHRCQAQVRENGQEVAADFREF